MPEASPIALEDGKGASNTFVSLPLSDIHYNSSAITHSLWEKLIEYNFVGLIVFRQTKIYRYILNTWFNVITSLSICFCLLFNNLILAFFIVHFYDNFIPSLTFLYNNTIS